MSPMMVVMKKYLIILSKIPENRQLKKSSLLKNCEKCNYCKTYSSKYYSTLCIPLTEAKPINKNDIVLSTDQICAINSRFSNIFKAY